MGDFENCGCAFQDTPVLQNACPALATVFMLFVESTLRATCSISDPCRRLRSVPEPLEEYDFVVVGAGVAGAIVASRLTEVADWNVLLVEAGPPEPTVAQTPYFLTKMIHTVLDWSYTTETQQFACLNSGGVCRWPRGKAVGGTGIFNGLMYMRGHPKDYDNWESAGNEGWGWDGVLPFFLKSEDNRNPEWVEAGYHARGGLLPVEQYPDHPVLADDIMAAARELGYRGNVTLDLNGKNMTGFAVAQMNSLDGVRVSTARAFLRPFRDRPNLHVLLDTTVTKIVIDPTTKRATGIEYLLNNTTPGVAKVKQDVVLSAGTINSPQLLLLSGVGPAEDLENLGIQVVQDLPVGHNLHNHVSFTVGFTINDTSVNELSEESLYEYVSNVPHRGPLSSTGLSQVTGYIETKYAEEGYPDIQFYFSGYQSGCSSTGDPEECTDHSIGNCGRRSVSIRPTVMNPKSKGYLTLGPNGAPSMNPKYFSEHRDVETLVEGIKFSVQLGETDALKKWDFQLVTTKAAGCEEYEFGTDEYWECAVAHNTLPENHQAGTTKMGPGGDPEAVVDPRLRVHGVPNIRVIDASIFPQVPHANPIAAIIMAAEKGAHMIKEDYNVPDEM